MEHKVFAVYSSKGGAGKTTIAVNLAVALAQQNPEQVGMLDLSLTFGHTPILLDLQSRAGLSSIGVDALPRLDREAFFHYLVPHASTLRLLPGAVRPEDGEVVTQEHVQQSLALMKRFFSYVVVDTSSDFADTTLAALEAADRIVFICTPELTTVRDVLVCQRIFRDVVHLPPERFFYVLNHPYGFTALSREDFERGMGRPVDAEIPFGGNGPAQAAMRGEVLVSTQPGHPVVRAIDTLARTQQTGLHPAEEAGKRGGPLSFLRRER